MDKLQRKKVVIFLLLIHLLFLNGWMFGEEKAADNNCASPEHRQFDFWVGTWTVRDNSNGKVVGESKIEPILNDCVVLENWYGTDGFLGKSFNLYEKATGRWKQRWVDSRGQLLELEGKFTDNAMRLEGEFRSARATSVRARMTFQDLGNGKVRQIWEQSADDGKTFKMYFDGTYEKKTDTN